MNIQTIKNVSDCIPLYLPHSLYLKPYAKLSISVSLPTSIPGKTISNWDVMEKLRQIIVPETFSVIKISKSTLEFIRFDAEIEDKEKLRNVLNRLDGRSIKLSNFAESVKVRAKEGRDGFPMKHDWDSFFRDARDMDEMKPGERPDTIHITNLPVRWFCPRHLENAENVKPSENIFKRIFEKFGDVRSVDIPICDSYRAQMKSHMSGMKTFSFDQDLFFEGYVQFSEYISFVRAMDAFRGMKLIRKEGEKNYGVNIAVHFDKTKHLSDLSTKRRAIVRERLISKERAKEDEEKKKIAEEEDKKERERRKQEEVKLAEFEKQRMREEKRKERQLKKLRDKEQVELSVKIREEEKKLLTAQRKLESIRLLEALFERIKIKVSREQRRDVNNEPKLLKNKEKLKKNDLNNKSVGTDLRNKLVKKIKTAQEKEYQKYKERVKRVKEGKIIINKILTVRSPSVNSISSNDSILNESDKKKRKKKKLDNSDTSDSDSSDSSADGSGSDAEEKVNIPPQMMMPPHGFPMQPVYNPQTGTWMGMYPYTPMFTQGPIRPNFISNSMNMRGFRGGGRGGNPRFHRGRGQYRGRGSYYNAYESNPHYRHYNKHKYDEQEANHDYQNSRSRSRTRSSSRSRTRSRSKSYSRSRGRRSRSYTKGRHSKSRSRSHSHSKSKKLVSTRRRTKSPESSRSRSRSSRSSSGWSHFGSEKQRNKKRSWSRTSSQNRFRSQPERKPSRFDNHSPKEKHGVVLEPEKIFEEAEKIKISVQKRLNQENNLRSHEKSKEPEKAQKKRTRRRSSSSADSAKFAPPKHRERSDTPEKQWN